MAYKHYHIWLVVRVILLLANVLLTGTVITLIGQRELFFLPLILLVVLVLQITDLIVFTNRTNKDIARFINNLGHGDIIEKFDDRSASASFRKLFGALNNVVARLSESRLEKEAQYNYLQGVISHISTGIVSLKGSDEIYLINEPAKKILNIAEHSRWSDVRTLHPGFAGEIDRIRGRGSRLIELVVNNEHRQLSVHVTSLVLLGSRYRIITLQDIRTEIEQKEIEAWHKLIQVLRHEIRNSVTPITSMTETILMLVEDQLGQARNPAELTEKDMKDIYTSIRTVHERSDHLYHFVEKYRQLTKIPPPVRQEINIASLLGNMAELFRTEAEEKKIRFVVDTGENGMVAEADPSLIEQVVINLIKNSIQALHKSSRPEIRLSARETADHLYISVEDNGPGIEPGMLQDIFLPFYTTRTEGMGIGLSLSRQIMNLHGGYLSVESNPGRKTVFTMALPK
jgi:two-component system nitrogen regulation sensor histidine kinase NtrY